MKRWKWNYLIDAGLFICMMAIAGIGLLMKYILLPGREVNLIYGGQTDLLFLGMDRHQWGSIHFIVSLVLLGLLLLHIILHWSMIVAFFRRFVPGRRARYVVGYAFLVTAVILIGFPIFARPEPVSKTPLRQFERGEGVESALHEPGAELTPRQASRRTAAGITPDTTGTPAAGRPAGEDSLAGEHSRRFDIRGYMTVSEISRTYGVPESYLLEGLGITGRDAARERFGQLRRRYDFTMSDVEEIILEYRRAHPPPPYGS